MFYDQGMVVQLFKLMKNAHTIQQTKGGSENFIILYQTCLKAIKGLSPKISDNDDKKKEENFYKGLIHPSP